MQYVFKKVRSVIHGENVHTLILECEHAYDVVAGPSEDLGVYIKLGTPVRCVKCEGTQTSGPLITHDYIQILHQRYAFCEKHTLRDKNAAYSSCMNCALERLHVLFGRLDELSADPARIKQDIEAVGGYVSGLYLTYDEDTVVSRLTKMILDIVDTAVSMLEPQAQQTAREVLTKKYLEGKEHLFEGDL